MNRIMTAFAAVVLALLSTSPVQAQPARILEEAIAATSWRSADFTHLFRLHGSDQEIVESGRVTFGSLPQMRWEYAAPEEKVFVFDGKTSWLYVPAERQVSVHELTPSERSQLPFLLLENAEAAQRDFAFATANRDGMLQLSLTPKTESHIRSMTLSLDPDSRRISAIEYVDVEDNLTRFEFDGFRQVRKDPKLFSFEAPAGVESVEY